MSRKFVQDDKELLQMSQMELKRLQRQYRIMEGDKNSYASEIKCYLIKQRKIIETLENEEQKLMSKMRAEKFANAPQFTDQWEKHFNESLKTYEKYLDLIKQKKETISKSSEKIKQLQSERKVLLFYGDSKIVQMNEDVKKSMKHVHLLQNKLHYETVKYDKALAENSAIRQEVDTLLKERARFNDLYKKLVIKLNVDKKKLLGLVEQATLACEQRDEADEKLKTSLSKEEQETITQKHKMRELHRQLDQFMQLKEFLSVKGQKRILADLEEKENTKKQQKIELIEKYTKTHNCILEQIKAFCGETNSERLAAIFIKQEDENFAFFNYVNEINNEVEMLQAEVGTLSASLEEQKIMNVPCTKERNESYQSFKKELESKQKLVSDKKEEFSSIEKVLLVLFKEMENICLVFQNNSPSLIHLLGGNKVSSSNAELFLDIIEKKVEDYTDT